MVHAIMLIRVSSFTDKQIDFSFSLNWNSQPVSPQTFLTEAMAQPKDIHNITKLYARSHSTNFDGRDWPEATTNLPWVGLRMAGHVTRLTRARAAYQPHISRANSMLSTVPRRTRMVIGNIVGDRISLTYATWLETAPLLIRAVRHHICHHLIDATA
jgi:hypothetical protein